MENSDDDKTRYRHLNSDLLKKETINIRIDSRENQRVAGKRPSMKITSGYRFLWKVWYGPPWRNNWTMGPNAFRERSVQAREIHQ